jgi:hypothetical protein
MTKFTLERVTQPEVEPVTLAEMKRHLRAFSSVTDEDSDITALIVAAREWVEDYTGRALIDQQWKLTLNGRPGSFSGGDIVSGARDGALPVGYYAGIWNWGNAGEIMLRKSPVLMITAFKSVDVAGVETTVDPLTYQLREADSKWPRVVALNGGTWSTWLTGDLRITYRAGFADTVGSPGEGAEVVPVRFKQAIKLWVEANYDRDEKMMPILLETAECLIKPERSELQIA